VLTADVNQFSSKHLLIENAIEKDFSEEDKSKESLQELAIYFPLPPLSQEIRPAKLSLAHATPVLSGPHIPPEPRA
jgi:hypothetical protein